MKETTRQVHECQVSSIHEERVSMPLSNARFSWLLFSKCVSLEACSLIHSLAHSFIEGISESAGPRGEGRAGSIESLPGRANVTARERDHRMYRNNKHGFSFSALQLKIRGAGNLTPPSKGQSQSRLLEF